MARVILDGNVKDQNDVPVGGALVYIYDDNGLASLTDSMDEPVENPVTTSDDGYWEAWVLDDAWYTLKYFWGGRLRLIEANIRTGDLPAGPPGPPGQDATELAQKTEVVATDGQTVFDLGFEYFPGIVTVFQSGLLLKAVDYSAPGGTEITLAEPAAAGITYTFYTLLPNNSLVQRYNVIMFGAGGDLADNGPVWQAMFDYAEEHGINEIEVPVTSSCYPFTTQASYTGSTPLKLIGLAPTGGRAIADYDQPAIRWDGAVGTGPLVFQTDGASAAEALNGLELENLLIFRLTPEEQGDGGIGLSIKGAYGGILRNITISGFDNGLVFNDDPVNAGATSVRCGKFSIYDLRVLQAASRRVRLRASAQCAFFNPSLIEESIPGYIADLTIEPGTNGGRSDGNMFFGGAFIGADDPGDQPDYNILVVDSPFNVFFGSAFERAAVAGCAVLYNTFDYTPNTFSVAFVSCWWDAQSGFCVDSNRARTFVVDPRCGAHAGAGAAFRFVGDPLAASAPRIGGGVRGGIIEFNGTEGISIVSAAGVEVSGTEGLDMNAGGAPLVRIDADSEDCNLIALRPGDDTVAYVDSGARTLVVDRTMQFDRWRIDDTFYAQIQSGDPVIALDASDYLIYDRSTNELQVMIAMALAGKFVAGGFSTPQLTVTGADITAASLPVYADNAAAIVGGLAAGRLYRTSVGAVMVRY